MRILVSRIFVNVLCNTWLHHHRGMLRMGTRIIQDRKHIWVRIPIYITDVLPYSYYLFGVKLIREEK